MSQQCSRAVQAEGVLGGCSDGVDRAHAAVQCGSPADAAVDAHAVLHGGSQCVMFMGSVQCLVEAARSLGAGPMPVAGQVMMQPAGAPTSAAEISTVAPHDDGLSGIDAILANIRQDIAAMRSNLDDVKARITTVPAVSGGRNHEGVGRDAADLQFVPSQEVFDEQGPMPQVQIIDQVVEVPAQQQIQVPVGSKVQKTVEVPLVVGVDRGVHVHGDAAAGPEAVLARCTRVRDARRNRKRQASELAQYFVLRRGFSLWQRALVAEDGPSSESDDDPIEREMDLIDDQLSALRHVGAGARGSRYRALQDRWFKLDAMVRTQVTAKSG